MISAEKVKKEEHTMNNLEEVRTKLYVEPAYLKSEKSLLKLMLNKEFYEYIINEISENDFNLEAHSKIFSLIKEGNEQNASNIVSYVGSRCDDVSSSKEWVIIQETEVMQAEDINKLINDYIVKIKSFRLIERQRDLKKEQKELEAKGMIEESIRLALDLQKVNEELNKLKVRGHNGRREDGYGRN